MNGGNADHGLMEFPRKSGHRVNGYWDRSYVAGLTKPRDEWRRWLLENTSMDSKIAALASSLVAKSASWTSSFFRLAKKDSIGALSQHWPTPLMLHAIPSFPR